MRFTQLTLVALLAVTVANSGCQRNESMPPAGTAQTNSHSHDDGTAHEHTDADGDHSAGVSQGHDHGNGPHGGALADWSGGKFHAEFTVNHDQTEATVYILGADGKTGHAIDAAEIMLVIKDPKMQLALKASPQSGDPSGKASCFVGNHDGLSVVQEYEGSISGVDAGTPYSGNFKEVVSPTDSKSSN